jgi:GNAT superfamily N-acetyltransferase
MAQRIVPIAEHLEWVSTIARWHWEEWGHHDPAGSLQSWTAGLAQRTHAAAIPTTFVAIDGDLPIGSACLVEHDMLTRPDLSPWLAGVFVVPEQRRRGIGSALVKHATTAAVAFVAPTLFLYTNGSERVYAKLGWRVREYAFYEGRTVTIMQCDSRPPYSGDVYRARARLPSG